jgi:predicted DNA-binding transcriptional regulator AlpA
MKSKRIDDAHFTVEQMSEQTGISKKSLLCAIKRLRIPRKKAVGTNAYTFTNSEFKIICDDDYVFEKMHNYRLSDYSMPPVVITYYIYESKMNE